MKLTKAIELLQLDLDDPGCVPIEDLNDAQALGIKALKRIYNNRATTPGSNFILLPGEDEE